MGREVKRVRLDFDWPIGRIWPGYMGGICTEDIRYILGLSEEADVDTDELCVVCRRAGKLAGIKFKPHGCPNWQIDPPEGEGWQMWETCTEGSPMSPVFKTPEELARWLADNNASAFGNLTATYEQWLGMIKTGWAPSATCIIGKELKSGVEFMADERKKIN